MRFMADSDIKNPCARSLPPSLRFPLSFSLYHTDSSACSWLLKCGSGAGWRTYCSINHVPILRGDARDSEGRPRPRPRSVSSFFHKEYKDDKYSSESGAASKCTYPYILISVKRCSPFLCQALRVTLSTVS